MRKPSLQCENTNYMFDKDASASLSQKERKISSFLFELAKSASYNVGDIQHIECNNSVIKIQNNNHSFERIINSYSVMTFWQHVCMISRLIAR